MMQDMLKALEKGKRELSPRTKVRIYAGNKYGNPNRHLNKVEADKLD